ncbi:MAG: alkaline phosphatase, partial [Paludibacteraceae bacterium]|nr:alkaline phosphatase [Paludibacteraceae bacterium]
GYADAQTKLGADKLILVQANDGIDKNKPSESIPYAIDRKEGDLTLPQIVETAIAYLAPKGKFFMMIEGGKIDYAGHGDDAATNIQEVLDFDQAIELAYQFYLAHPDETRIVVTADHETGGMALGTDGKYFLNLKALQEQRQSIGQVQKKRDHKAIRQLNATARVGWTSSAHTAANVPVFAIGVGAERFTGWYDNTEIVKKIKAGR